MKPHMLCLFGLLAVCAGAQEAPDPKIQKAQADLERMIPKIWNPGKPVVITDGNTAPKSFGRLAAGEYGIHIPVGKKMKINFQGGDLDAQITLTYIHRKRGDEMHVGLVTYMQDGTMGISPTYVTLTKQEDKNGSVQMSAKAPGAKAELTRFEEEIGDSIRFYTKELRGMTRKFNPPLPILDLWPPTVMGRTPANRGFGIGGI